MLMNIHAAAAVAIVGVDIAANERKRVSSVPRVLSGVGFVGSTAVDDCEVDIYIGDFYVGRFHNTHAGVIQIDRQSDIIPVGPFSVRPGDQISCIIVLAAVANPVNLLLV